MHELRATPFFFAAGNEPLARLPVKHFFDARGSATEPDTKIGKKFGGEAKFKFAFKPLAGVTHIR